MAALLGCAIATILLAATGLTTVSGDQWTEETIASHKTVAFTTNQRADATQQDNALSYLITEGAMTAASRDGSIGQVSGPTEDLTSDANHAALSRHDVGASPSRDIDIESVAEAAPSRHAAFRNAETLSNAVTCPSDAIEMDEPCGEDMYGGCNMDDPNFFAINCGDTICGTAWADNALRDTDWFEIVIDETITFTFSGTAEFAFRIGLVNTGGSGDCDDVTGLNPQAAGGAGEKVSITTTVGPGTYWLFMASQDFHGNPCGSGSNDYVVSLECEHPPASCGVPNTGNCCDANGTPYCEDEECCQQICAQDPYCCDVEWDADCAAAAVDPESGCAACVDCGYPDTGDCCEGQVNSPFCEDEICCQQICADDPYCCVQTWDSVCAATAQATCEVCFHCGHEAAGDCCEATGTTHCRYEGCCNQICAEDPYCCEVEWDQACADTANDPETGCINCVPLACPDGGQPEPEPCGEDVNGGCNMVDGPEFTPITCGDIFCGTAWADDGWRDTDWYEFRIPPGEAYEVTFTAYAEFPMLMGLIANNGTGTCSNAGGLDPFVTAKPEQEVSVTVELTPGDWWFFVAPSVFNGYPCGIGTNEYWVRWDCEEQDACLGDVNGNGQTGLADLIQIVNSFGPCPYEGWPGSCEGVCGEADDSCFCDEACCLFGDCCLDKYEVCEGCEPAVPFCGADLNGDGVVDWFDLLLLLDDWGCEVEGLPDPLECPDGAIEMDEPCGKEFYNGCNMSEPEFFQVECGDTVCGTAWAENNARDTDWLELVLEETTTVTFNGTAEFQFVIGLVDNDGNGSCKDAAFLDPFVLGEPYTSESFTVTLDPGIYWFFMAEQNFSNNPCNDFQNNYFVSIECD